ncbi:hypothetical protein [Spongorhabdus nitratireducens]
MSLEKTVRLVFTCITTYLIFLSPLSHARMIMEVSFPTSHGATRGQTVGELYIKLSAETVVVKFTPKLITKPFPKDHIQDFFPGIVDYLETKLPLPHITYCAVYDKRSPALRPLLSSSIHYTWSQHMDAINIQKHSTDYSDDSDIYYYSSQNGIARTQTQERTKLFDLWSIISLVNNSQSCIDLQQYEGLDFKSPIFLNFGCPHKSGTAICKIDRIQRSHGGTCLELTLSEKQPEGYSVGYRQATTRYTIRVMMIQGVDCDSEKKINYIELHKESIHALTIHRKSK